MAESFRAAIAEIRIETPQVNVPELRIPDINVPEAKVTVNIPEIKLPTINVPEPKVTVNLPEVKIPPFPELKMPESMEIHGDVGLFGYGFDNPLPVQLRDANGNPVSLPEMMSVASGGGGPRFVKINNTASEPIPISGNITSTPGATYYASDAIGSVNIVQSIPIDVTVVGANGTIGVVTINPDGLPVYSGGSSGGTVSVSDIFGTVGTNVVNPDGRLKVELPTGSSGLTNTELRAATLDVQQVSGTSWSTSVISMPAVVVTSITNSTAVSILNGDGSTLDPRNRTWTITETVPISSANTLDVKQVSGASDSVSVLSMPAVTVTSITNSTATTILNGEGIARDTWGSTQVGTWNINTLTGVTNTLAVANIDSTGVQYSGSNPVPTKEVRSATPSQTSPSVGIASTSILAANANRLGATIYNEGSAICYMKLGSTASLTSYSLQIASGGYYEVPFGYTGAIDGITSASTAQLRVTEIT
jgi:hypothetical protein